ncbi:hypothetical protein X798_01460 [Onchocerca flexuosa]|uniref:Uncharacterized protein n=1 Tax=Onchocerca flexuosa TaxID=387005 RepID=A0A238C2A8_9BILA|nr:hypothetical protein X798_01460 [Onchocerca flexuosa]
MHHYFPPKNFTDRCWEPDSEIGTVPCRGSCFILVEEIYEHWNGAIKRKECEYYFEMTAKNHDRNLIYDRDRKFKIMIDQNHDLSTHAIMRGCVNRFLLFGLDEDVRDALTDKSECRTTDRRLLHLVALTPQTDLVYIFELNCGNVLMYGPAMQSRKHGLRPVDRCFFCMQRIPSDSYADFSLRSAHLDDISLVHVTCHALKAQEI